MPNIILSVIFKMSFQTIMQNELNIGFQTLDENRLLNASANSFYHQESRPRYISLEIHSLHNVISFRSLHFILRFSQKIERKTRFVYKKETTVKEIPRRDSFLDF